MIASYDITFYFVHVTVLDNFSMVCIVGYSNNNKLLWSHKKKNNNNNTSNRTA